MLLSRVRPKLCLLKVKNGRHVRHDDPSSLETLNRTHILIMALDAVIDEIPHADVEALVG
jgi:hypothetical protein